jgi:predicted TIM-barrel fold metal-dependent hydrolase
MAITRRTFVRGAATWAAGAGAFAGIIGKGNEAFAAPAPAGSPTTAARDAATIDTHVHVWDLKQFRLPWLDHAGDVLDRTYTPADYVRAVEGLDVARAVYVEVSVAAEQHLAEARYAIELCASKRTPVRVAVIGGAPGKEGFAAYIDAFKRDPAVRGVRSSFPAGRHRDARFLDDLHRLSDLGFSYDLLLGSELLSQAAHVVAACPKTRFVLDHCGNPSLDWLEPSGEPANPVNAKRFGQWQDWITALGQEPNVYCKISGVAESGGKRGREGDGSLERMARIVNHCLDQFGAERVMFASNWPVCLNAITLRGWVETLRQITASRGSAFQDKLFRANGLRCYRMDD